MDWTTWLNHALHVLLPACVLASVVTVWARIWQWRKKQCVRFIWHWLCLFIAGAMASIAVLWWLQKDGTMLGYVALVLAMGSVQALLAGWAKRVDSEPVTVPVDRTI